MNGELTATSAAVCGGLLCGGLVCWWALMWHVRIAGRIAMTVALVFAAVEIYTRAVAGGYVARGHVDLVLHWSAAQAGAAWRELWAAIN